MDLHAVSSVQFSCSVVSDSLRPRESQYARPPWPSPTPGVYPNSCPSSQWCHPAISSSVVPFSSCPQSLPASGSFPMSQLFSWGGQGIGISSSTSVLPMNTQNWSPLGWTGWISLKSKGLSRVLSNTTVHAVSAIQVTVLGLSLHHHYCLSGWRKITKISPFILRGFMHALGCWVCTWDSLGGCSTKAQSMGFSVWTT